MPTTEKVRLEWPRLFRGIIGLDERILEDLAKVKAEYAIVICKVNLPPGEVLRLAGEQYGIYVLTTRDGHRVAKGIRTERGEDGQNGKTFALKTIRETLPEASGEPLVVEFNYRATSSW